MSSAGAAPRAAVPASAARAQASRRNGARSRGPTTAAGKARAAQNALKHGLRAQKHVVLPQENAAEFAELHALLIAELAPVGALQTVLARRAVIAAWRLARADRMEVEALAVRSYEGASPGLALIRDGNGTRAFETLMRYRSAATAELMRALRSLKALQAEQAATLADAPSEPAAKRRGGRTPNEPERLPEPYVLPASTGPGRTLHEDAAPSTPSGPGRQTAVPARARADRAAPNEPGRTRAPNPESPGPAGPLGNGARHLRVLRAQARPAADDAAAQLD